MAIRRRGTRSPAEFARTYRADTTSTYGERCAAFLNEAAEELPYRFLPKPIVAKIALGRSRTPGPDTDDVRKRLPSILQSAERILAKANKYREIYVDPVEGIRATVNEDDLVRTKRRRKMRGLNSKYASLQRTDARIDPSKVSPKYRKELFRSRKALKVIGEAIGELPLLPPAKGNEE